MELCTRLERDLIVRQHLPGDEDQIVKLLQIVFQGWPHFDLDHFEGSLGLEVFRQPH
jgi:hypothetical protein